MPVLHLKVKARSAVDLSRAGVYRYFDPSGEVLCAAWAIGDGPVQLWFPGESCPTEIAGHVKSKGAITGFGITFERLAWNRTLGPKHGWPLPKPEQFHDTMAAAAALSLPRRVEDAAKVLGLAIRQDEEGRRLHLLMSMRQEEASVGDLKRLGHYAVNEVETERALYQHTELYPLSLKEREIWLLDQKINDRGIAMDRDLVADMLAVVEAHQETLDHKLAVATGNAVMACAQIPSLQKWLAAHGVEAPSLSRDGIETLLAQTMPDHCREALMIRSEGSKTSNHKLATAMACTSSDGRARGLLVYHGASTGRWSGRLWGPQNLPRGSGIVGNQRTAINLIRHRRVDLLEWAYDKPLTVISDCLRGVMTAALGHVLLVGDFASIDARVTAWMANDHAKLNAFRNADRGDGPDLYRIATSRIYNVPETEIGSHGDSRRQTGKTAELALGFGGGVDALAAMAATYHVDMASAFDSLWAAASPGQRAHAVQRHAEADSGELSGRAWLACELTVQAWRRANPLTVAAWGEFGNALRRAVSEPEKIVEAPHVALRHKGLFLGMRLPSGRVVYYPRPAMEGDGTITAYTAKEDRRPRGKAPPKGRRYLHGGLLFQHAVQGMARDLLADAMLRLEAAGFPVVMSIHDEIICEVSHTHAGDLDQFRDLLCEVPTWADGLPIVAKGWSGFRYRKS